ncbi:MAG: hypothetical protein KAW12_13455 [Candidatus Aminicenantes bacterium]|nr:hypothetical protein [Candidatus Aminicenantes bacterium]
MKEKICVHNIKHNGQWYKPGDTIKLSDAEIKKLGGSVMTATEYKTYKSKGGSDTRAKEMEAKAAAMADEIEKLKGDLQGALNREAKLKEEKKAGGN